jgi:ATP-binding cassette subfamily B protein
MENIRYGNLNATDNQVIEAAKKANCHEFIMQLNDDYQTLVGERGIKLSGGQRQRIAIARAILKNAPILILDEATSALDSITEKYIQDSLNQLMQNRTTIVVAHRLSTLAKMDRIIVFDNGKIIEDGNHQMLLNNNSHYAKLWNMQAGGFLPEKEE